jgi:hypothetical protein
MMAGQKRSLNMKPLALPLVLLASIAVASPPVQKSVPTVLGPKAYRAGDVVEITDVTATSARLEPGDSVTVRGRVRLESRSAGRLCLFLTQTEGNGSEEVDSQQTQVVKRGSADFELKATIKHPGALHVTFYDDATGKPFGGSYFGTAEQMKQIANWNVNYYLED